MKHGVAITGVLLVCLIFAGAAPAATVQQLVDARVAAMKQNGQIIRGAKNLSGDKAVQAATTVLKNFKAFPGLFPEGSLTRAAGRPTGYGGTGMISSTA